MPVFAYQGRGAQGVTTGEIEAPDRTAAVGELRSRAILVTKIAEKAGGKATAKVRGGVNDREMAIFTRQFSTMIDAGLPLVQCLNILASRPRSPAAWNRARPWPTRSSGIPGSSTTCS